MDGKKKAKLLRRGRERVVSSLPCTRVQVARRGWNEEKASQAPRPLDPPAALTAALLLLSGGSAAASLCLAEAEAEAEAGSGP